MSWAGSMASSHAPTLSSALNQQGITTYNAAQAQKSQYNLAQQAQMNNAAAQGMAQQSIHQAQQQLARMYSQALKPKEFKINGIEYATLEEFLDALYPEDCAEKTYLALKLTKGNENDNT